MQAALAAHLFLSMFGLASEVMEVLLDGCCVLHTVRFVADALVSRVLLWTSVVVT